MSGLMLSQLLLLMPYIQRLQLLLYRNRKGGERIVESGRESSSFEEECEERAMRKRSRRKLRGG